MNKWNEYEVKPESRIGIQLLVINIKRLRF